MKTLLTSLTILSLTSSIPAQDKIEIPVKPDLKKTLSQLHTDGDHLSITNVKGDLKFYADLIDSLLLNNLKKEQPLYSKVSAAKVLDISGLDQATTIGRSSKWIEDHHHNRIFIETGGSNFGLLSIIDNQPKPWQSAAFAPKGTDLLLETTLNLSQVPQITNQIANLVPDESMDDVTGYLDEIIPGSQMTVREALTGLNARISIAIKLDPTKKWSPEKGLELPAFQACVRFDGIAKKAWPILKPQIEGNLPFTSEGNIHTIPSPEAIPTPWGNIKPVVIVNLDTDQLWIADTADFLKACQSSEDKLLTAPEYLAATKDLPTTGFAHTYMSNEGVQLIASLINTVAKQVESKGDDLVDPQEIEKLTTEFLQSKFGYASAAKHDDNGLLFATNSPMADKGSSLTTQYITIVPGLAAMSYGPIMKQVKASKRTEAMNSVKKLYVETLSYAQAHQGNFPPSLEKLAEWTEKANGIALSPTIDWPLPGDEVNYNSGFAMTSKPGNIIFYSEIDEEGERIVGTLDGAVQSYSEEEFQALMKKQAN